MEILSELIGEGNLNVATIISLLVNIALAVWGYSKKEKAIVSEIKKVVVNIEQRLKDNKITKDEANKTLEDIKNIVK